MQVKVKDQDKIIAMTMSDFHIGENNGAVTTEPLHKINYIKKEGCDYFIHNKVDMLIDRVEAHIKKHGKIDYLILIGDIFDIAVKEKSDVFNLAHDFFSKYLVGNFNEVIYIPGNHDHHMWELLQNDEFVNKRIEVGKKASSLPHTLELKLELDEHNEHKIVHLDEENHISKNYNFIVSLLSNHKNKVPVHISYPNLYIECGQKLGICVTHGHLLEVGWNKSDEVIPHFSSIVLDDTDYFKNIERKNMPFTEFSNYLIAQSYGESVERLVDAPRSNKFMKYIAAEFPEFFTLPCNNDSLPNICKLYKEKLIVNEYLSSVLETMKNNELSFDILLYGHTHVPSFGDDYNFLPKSAGGYNKEIALKLYNTGGWVGINNNIDYINPNCSNKLPNPMYLSQNGEFTKVLYEKD